MAVKKKQNVLFIDKSTSTIFRFATMAGEATWPRIELFSTNLAADKLLMLYSVGIRAIAMMSH